VRTEIADIGCVKSEGRNSRRIVNYRTKVEAEQRIGDLQRQLAAIEMNVLNRILEIVEKRLPDPAVRSS
jgi:hypothetical protein